MRLIHCADMHLDSRMTSNLTKEKARERKKELLLTFERMVDYAAENRVDAILIAGDLFDTSNISATARHAVWDAVCGHSDITFYYLKGNHDTDHFLASREEIPGNLKRFGTEWTSYSQGAKVTVTALELTSKNAAGAADSLVLDPEKFNIVMLHGQIAEAGAKEKMRLIRLRDFKNKGIDYLALGHIHAYREGGLDTRGVWCYSGCLEGRGFDECGAHGFVLLDVDEETGTCSRQFVPFAKRRIFAIPVDVTGCETAMEMAARTETAIREMRLDTNSGAPCEEDLVKIVLHGETDVEQEIDADYLRKRFEPEYYFVKIDDETMPKVDVSRFLLDASLKGEFVRTVMSAEELSPEDRTAVIRCGLRAIAGEEILECD
ncbi:MAG: DNA repair exonuclease [Clostridiales bacterium]|nr:DNA repair exonuclease [Clostridiales bacterium]